MKAKIYYYIGDYDDSVIIEGNDMDELRQKCKEAIESRGATYTGAEIIEEE